MSSSAHCSREPAVGAGGVVVVSSRSAWPGLGASLSASCGVLGRAITLLTHRHATPFQFDADDACLGGRGRTPSVLRRAALL